jgi:DNA-binding MarR family transcriptional regulator
VDDRTKDSAIDDVNRLRIALGRISRLVDRQVSGDGMTRTQLSALGTIARNRSIGVGDLADVEGFNPTMCSRMIGKLEAAGLVRRAQGEDDRREVRVEITAAGTRLHSRLRDQRSKLLRERLDQLTARDRRALLAAVPALESLAEAMRPAESRPDARAENRPERTLAGK